MDIITEYIERMIGPFLFVAGMALFLAQYQHESTYVQDVQEVYVSDDVYAQHYDKSRFNDYVTRDQIFASVVNDVNCDIIIDCSKYYYSPIKLEIRNLAGQRFQIKVFKPGAVPSVLELSDFQTVTSLQGYKTLSGYGLWELIPKEFESTLAGAPEKGWRYTPEYTRNSDGSVKEVTYVFDSY